MPLPIAVVRINKLVHEQGLSVREFQKIMGKHIGAISNWNRSSPKLETLIPIADFLNTSLDYLGGRTENPFMAEDFESLTEVQKVLIRRIISNRYDDTQVSIINEYLDETENFSKSNKSEVK